MQSKVNTVSTKLVESAREFLGHLERSEGSVEDFLSKSYVSDMEMSIEEYLEGLSKIFKSGRPSKVKADKPVEMDNIFQTCIEDMNEDVKKKKETPEKMEKRENGEMGGEDKRSAKVEKLMEKEKKEMAKKKKQEMKEAKEQAKIAKEQARLAKLEEKMAKIQDKMKPKEKVKRVRKPKTVEVSQE